MDTPQPPVIAPVQTRTALRRTLRARRRALTPYQQDQAARALCRLMCRQPLFLRSRHIAFYLANDGEISPQRLLTQALRMGKHCYLPVLQPGSDKRLWFVRYREAMPMQTNRYGIAEPVPRAGSVIAARHLDLVLLPLVGFDGEGGRLGMGGGYYDRSFAFKSGVSTRKPYLLGLAHQCQQVDSLAVAHWDIPLQGVGTDGGLVLGQSGGLRRDFHPGDWHSPRSGVSVN